MKCLVSGLDQFLKLALIILMLSLIMLVVWQVVSRYLLADPSSYTEELARFVLIWVSLLGACYAFRLRMHLGLNLLTENLRGKKKYLAELVALLAVAVFAITVLIIGGINLVMLAWELNQLTAVLGIKVALVYSVVPLSGLIFIVYSVAFIRDLHAAPGNDYIIMPADAVVVEGQGE